MKRILVTGGTGFIGSHTIVQLQQAGHEVVIFDNLVNSSIDVVDRIAAISGVRPLFVEGDITDKAVLEKLFVSYTFDAVIHFAALKAVGSSCQEPFTYRENNILGTMHLLEMMDAYDVRTLVFSSSATVYDAGLETAPFDESMRTGHTTNPYGTTKYVVEQLLQDMVNWKGMKITALRYFNPVGAHVSGHIGEDPRDEPTNLLPILLQVVEGKRKALHIFGDDYPTSDGTCIRDYVHVMDLADAHVAAIQGLEKSTAGTYTVYNVGTGIGVSVLEMVTAVAEITQQEVPYALSPRRDGDVGVSIAAVDKIRNELGWSAIYTVREALQDAWNFRQKFYKDK